MAQLQPQSQTQTYHKQCRSTVDSIINAPIDLVWSLVRRFDRPQAYKRLVKTCDMVLGSSDQVGATRRVLFRTGLQGTTSIDRLERVDEDKHVIVYKVIGGDHKLLNFHVTTSLHENGKNTVVVESYTVDVPDDSNEEDTCFVANTIIKLNLESLAFVAEKMACVKEGTQ